MIKVSPHPEYLRRPAGTGALLLHPRNIFPTSKPGKHGARTPWALERGRSDTWSRLNSHQARALTNFNSSHHHRALCPLVPPTQDDVLAYMNVIALLNAFFKLHPARRTRDG